MAEATQIAASSAGISGSSPSSFTAVTVVSQGGVSNVRIPSDAYTLDGFRHWLLSEDAPERGRFTYVAGELIADMSPESYERHNGIKVEITSVLHRLSRQRKLGRVFGDRVLVSNPGAGVSTEPDATFASFESLRSGRCKIVQSSRPGVAEELLGSPDWALEIVSPTSVRKDTVLLRDAYYRAGIAEYWIVDVLSDKIEFKVLLRGAEAYSESPDNEDWIASPTFGSHFRLTREVDQDDLWQYTLEVSDIK
jgi:Uma2 family endonuclease